MTDRELLEAAGEAFGFDHLSIHADGKVYGHDGVCNPVAWNPLTDDGDALRLAVKLRMDIAHFEPGVRADVTGYVDCYQANDLDPYAATRRAIVRAAATLKLSDRLM